MMMMVIIPSLPGDCGPELPPAPLQGACTSLMGHKLCVICVLPTDRCHAVLFCPLAGLRHLFLRPFKSKH